MEHLATKQPGIGAKSASHEKYLTFKLGEESYGLNVLTVREIISLPNIPKLPQTVP